MVSVKKALLPIAALSLFSTLYAKTTDDAQIHNIENRLTALEQRKGANGVINPSARFGVKDGQNVFITGEALLLKATETGLPYGVMVQDNTTRTANPSGRIRNQNMEWLWGFRVGVGYNMCHDEWDAALTWTRFHNKHTNNLSGTSTNNVGASRLAPGILSGDTRETFGSIESWWQLHFNQVDLDMGRMFYVSKFLKIRPHAGLRMAWIDQNFRVFYKDGIGSETYREKDRNDFWGMGLVGGMNTLWGLGNGWAIYADAAVSLVYGSFTLNNNQVETTSVATESSNYFNANQKVKCTRAMTDLALGLRWDRNFSDDRFHIGFNAGWEQHIYFDQNQLIRYVDDIAKTDTVSNQGDLTLQGFAFGARFDF